MSAGKLLLLVGGILVLIGFLLWLAERGGSGRPWSWIGHLPGDIRVEREGFRFYFPLATCLLISAVVTALLRLFRR